MNTEKIETLKDLLQNKEWGTKLRYFEENTIREIYYHMSHNIIGMSWGINSPTIFSIEHQEEDYTFKRNVLIFKVQGYLFKGKVLISLNFLDYFNIDFFNENDIREETLKDISIDNLIDVLDKKIETKINL